MIHLTTFNTYYFKNSKCIFIIFLIPIAFHANVIFLVKKPLLCECRKLLLCNNHKTNFLFLNQRKQFCDQATTNNESGHPKVRGKQICRNG